MKKFFGFLLIYFYISYSGEGSSATLAYKSANEKIEKITNQSRDFAWQKFCPLYIFPNMIFSYFNYFYKLKSNNSFRLAMPAS